ncbi:TIGR02679 family protein [Streptomyces sp. 6N223]|uniref:TIGR02679 family protein n=1 Tax=Streptomyces sp. 6N223 TaxID=3457412 RepID=UPI003FD58478
MTHPHHHPLDRPELLPLWRAVHQRLSTGRPVSRVRTEPLDEAGQEALADLLGLDHLPGPRPTVSLARLDSAVRDACDQDTRAAVTAIIGTVGDHAAEREAARAERAALWRWVRTHPVVTAQPALAGWADELPRAGLAGGSVPATRGLLDDALRTLAALPAGGEPLPHFAASVLGDPHALDDARRLTTVVLRALAALYGVAFPESAAERRALWAGAGVADDALSTTVLTAGLRPAGTGPVATSLTAYAEAGHATHLTLAHLRDPGGLRLPTTEVHVTENPSILALALRRFGPACPPLVCVAGWPNSAAVLLLRRLAEAGAPLLYHGDFDGEGLRIAAYVLAKTPARPWRMSTADYLQARARHSAGPDPGRVTDAPWDPDLAPALRAHGTAVMEEHVADALLADLVPLVSQDTGNAGTAEG